jgi:hypothetical protein
MVSYYILVIEMIKGLSTLVARWTTTCVLVVVASTSSRGSCNDAVDPITDGRKLDRRL